MRQVPCLLRPSETCTAHTTCQRRYDNVVYPAKPEKKPEVDYDPDDCDDSWHTMRPEHRCCPSCGARVKSSERVTRTPCSIISGATCIHNTCKTKHATAEALARQRAASRFTGQPTAALEGEVQPSREEAAQDRVRALNRVRVSGGDKLIVACACGESLLSNGVIGANLNQLLEKALQHRAVCQRTT